jgi:nuclear GTP-binding protein
MGTKKYKSKRLGLHQQAKIRKKKVQASRKERKLQKKAKLNGGTKQWKSKKDLGIPNLFPFKAKLLSKIQRQREREEKHALGVKERRAAERKKRRMELRNTNQAKMVAEAAARATEFAETGARRMAYLDELKNGVKDGEAAQQTRRAFYAQLKRVIESSDVIIQVLDARDPEGCRASHIERMIVPKGKKLILLVNKVDLVPRHVTEAWLKHLRLEFPAIAFKANTQSGGRSLGRAMGKAEAAKDAVLSGAKCVGAETLMQLLKNYCRSLGMKTSITVGLVGYPNVGKSSVINSLKRARAAAVSPTPGMTKVMQEVTIDRNIKLLDCPGIIFGADAIDQMGHNENDSKGTGLVLRNCIGVDQLPDPVGAVEVLLRKCRPEFLMEFYGIGRYDPNEPHTFVNAVAAKRGRLKKGGVPDREAAARSVLRDLYTGKLPFYSLPPKQVGASEEGNTTVVTDWSAQFNLDRVYSGENARVIANLPSREKQVDSGDYMTFAQTDGADGEEQMAMVSDDELLAVLSEDDEML